MSVRVRGELFNRLDAAARENNRPLGSEVEFRLDRSFSPLPAGLSEEDWHLMKLFLATYRHGGQSAVMRVMVTALGDPDAEEIALRCDRVLRSVLQMHPKKTNPSWIATDTEGQSQ